MFFCLTSELSRTKECNSVLGSVEFELCVSHDQRQGCCLRKILRSPLGSQKYRASGRSRKKKPNFVGFSAANSRKKRPILREFCGDF